MSARPSEGVISVPARPKEGGVVFVCVVFSVSVNFSKCPLCLTVPVKGMSCVPVGHFEEGVASEPVSPSGEEMTSLPVSPNKRKRVIYACQSQWRKHVPRACQSQ